MEESVDPVTIQHSIHSMASFQKNQFLVVLGKYYAAINKANLDKSPNT